MRTRVVLTLMLIGGLFAAEAQYGYGNNPYYGGRRRNVVPQAEAPPKKVEPKTAEELVSEEMPGIIQAVGLNEFEAAVVSSILTKYVQKRMELQILELTPEATQEALERLGIDQRRELEEGLPEDKYQAMIELEESRYNTKKFKKKKKKQKKKT
ncbi:hypothetical protein [Robiginitalea sp. SC105]|uniref:hypothetical protein n=1 Tax=Robiginitalea sp. SC105 TaxID=2762332 RepID=UPI00163A4984|nr:hypothetical protein [Robiginitalea sp. SC105]MBC2840688.1 hypothetical protein [Robiginitalea sp. SC105]